VPRCITQTQSDLTPRLANNKLWCPLEDHLMWFVSIHSVFSAHMIRKIRGFCCLPSTNERFRIGGATVATKTHAASILDFLYAMHNVTWIIWLNTWVNYYIWPHLEVIIAVIGPEVSLSFSQRSIIGPYPGATSIHHASSLTPIMRFILILSSRFALTLLDDYELWRF
jgi:hypothetical protein